HGIYFERLDFITAASNSPWQYEKIGELRAPEPSTLVRDRQRVGPSLGARNKAYIRAIGIEKDPRTPMSQFGFRSVPRLR
ncbi:MAG: hypothetical protein CSA75_04535, partial [Sorangium cellulosum]